MNMKDLILAQSRILREEDSQSCGVLTVITAAGIICGVPVFSDYVPNSADEKIMMQIFRIYRDSDVLYGDASHFLLRDVLIRRDDKSIRAPWLIICYDSVVACSVSFERF